MANITAPRTPASKVSVPPSAMEYNSEAGTIVEAITAACSECCLLQQFFERVLDIAGHIREITSRNDVDYTAHPTVHAKPHVFHVYIYFHIFRSLPFNEDPDGLPVSGLCPAHSNPHAHNAGACACTCVCVCVCVGVHCSSFLICKRALGPLSAVVPRWDPLVPGGDRF